MIEINNKSLCGFFVNERVRYPCTIAHRLITHNYEAGQIKTLVLVFVDGELNTDDIYRSFSFADMNSSELDGLEFFISEMSVERTQSRPRFMVEATSVRSCKPMLFHADKHHDINLYYDKNKPKPLCESPWLKELQERQKPSEYETVVDLSQQDTLQLRIHQRFQRKTRRLANNQRRLAKKNFRPGDIVKIVESQYNSTGWTKRPGEKNRWMVCRKENNFFDFTCEVVEVDTSGRKVFYDCTNYEFNICRVGNYSLESLELT